MKGNTKTVKIGIENVVSHSTGSQKDDIKHITKHCLNSMFCDPENIAALKEKTEISIRNKTIQYISH